MSIMHATHYPRSPRAMRGRDDRSLMMKYFFHVWSRWSIVQWTETLKREHAHARTLWLGREADAVVVIAAAAGAATARGSIDVHSHYLAGLAAATGEPVFLTQQNDNQRDLWTECVCCELLCMRCIYAPKRLRPNAF